MKTKAPGLYMAIKTVWKVKYLCTPAVSIAGDSLNMAKSLKTLLARSLLKTGLAKSTGKYKYIGSDNIKTKTMPIDYKKYPPNWKTEIRPRIMERAGGVCEWPGCTAKHKALGFWKRDGTFEELSEGHLGDVEAEWAEIQGYKIIQIILTIAHLDHDPENWDVGDDRLAAFCQRHHLRYDAPHRKKKRLKGRYENTLFPIKKEAND